MQVHQHQPLVISRRNNFILYILLRAAGLINIYIVKYYLVGTRTYSITISIIYQPQNTFDNSKQTLQCARSDIKEEKWLVVLISCIIIIIYIKP